MTTAEKFMKDIEQWGFINALYLGGILLYAGIIFVANSLGILPKIGAAGAWSWIFFGAGLASLVGNLIRQASPKVINPSAFDYIFGAVLFAISLGGFTSMYIALSILLLLVGGVILYKATSLTGKDDDYEVNEEMNDEDKKTHDELFSFDMASCVQMMEKMMAGHSEECDCGEMISYIADQEKTLEEWQRVMSQAMEVHCTPQEALNTSVKET